MMLSNDRLHLKMKLDQCQHIPQGRGDIHRKCPQLASKVPLQAQVKVQRLLSCHRKCHPVPPPKVSPVPDLSVPDDSMSDGYAQGTPMSVTPDMSPDVDMEDMELPPPIPEQMIWMSL